MSCLARGAAADLGKERERPADGCRKAGTTACGRELAAILGANAVWKSRLMLGKGAAGVGGALVTTFLRIVTAGLLVVTASGALVVGAEVGGGVGRKSVMARSSKRAVWWTGRGPGSAGVGGSGRRAAGTAAGSGEGLPADILGSGLGSRGPPAGDCLPPLAGLRDLDFKKLLK